MEIHWFGMDGFDPQEKSAVEQRLEGLAEGHRDLLDVRMMGHVSAHHRHGDQEVRIACQAGASGFLVGRALWAPLVTAPAAEQPTILRDVVRPRLEELVAVATESGKDWARRHQLPDVDHTSFASYGGGP